MANPRPSPATRFQPGQSGNPAGYSRGRRITAALHDLLDRIEAKDELARTMYAMATGRTELLRDPETGEVRKPDLEWFRMMIDRIEGQPIDRGLEAALRVVVQRRDRFDAKRRQENARRRSDRELGSSRGQNSVY